VLEFHLVASVELPKSNSKTGRKEADNKIRDGERLYKMGNQRLKK